MSSSKSRAHRLLQFAPVQLAARTTSTASAANTRVHPTDSKGLAPLDPPAPCSRPSRERKLTVEPLSKRSRLLLGAAERALADAEIADAAVQVAVGTAGVTTSTSIASSNPGAHLAHQLPLAAVAATPPSPRFDDVLHERGLPEPSIDHDMPDYDLHDHFGDPEPAQLALDLAVSAAATGACDDDVAHPTTHVGPATDRRKVKAAIAAAMAAAIVKGLPDFRSDSSQSSSDSAHEEPADDVAHKLRNVERAKRALGRAQAVHRLQRRLTSAAETEGEADDDLDESAGHAAVDPATGATVAEPRKQEFANPPYESSTSASSENEDEGDREAPSDYGDEADTGLDPHTAQDASAARVASSAAGAVFVANAPPYDAGSWLEGIFSRFANTFMTATSYMPMMFELLVPMLERMRLLTFWVYLFNLRHIVMHMLLCWFTVNNTSQQSASLLMGIVNSIVVYLAGVKLPSSIRTFRTQNEYLNNYCVVSQFVCCQRCYTLYPLAHCAGRNGQSLICDTVLLPGSKQKLKCGFCLLGLRKKKTLRGKMTQTLQPHPEQLFTVLSTFRFCHCFKSWFCTCCVSFISARACACQM